MTNKSISIWLVVVMFIFSIYFLLPFYWILVSVTKDNGQLNTTFGLWFAYPWHLLNNFHEVFTRNGGIFWRWLGNSFLYSTTAATLATLFAAMAGFAFSKYNFFGRSFLFTLILGTIMIPATALAFPIFLLIQNVGLANTIWAVILPQTVSPFGLYLMRMFWDQSFPNELMEAAKLDGANDATVFWRLGIPLIQGGLVTVFLFTFVAVWNNFFLPLIVLGNNNLFPLPLGLAGWAATQTGSTPPYSAIILGALIGILPLVLSLLFLGRYWQAGLTVGATKG